MLLGLIFLEVSYGQTSKSNLKSYSTNSSKPFDLNAEALPPNYQGIDFYILYSELANRRLSTPTKGEFETTEEYKNRLVKHENAPLISGLKTDDLIGFVLTEPGLKVEYNADQEKFNIEANLISRHNCNTSTKFWWFCKGFILKQQYFDEGSYIAENAFGVKVRVKKERERIFFLELDGSSEPLSSFYYQYRLKANRKIAPSLKSRIGIVLIGNLTRNFVSGDVISQKPTRDNPFDSSRHYSIIQFYLKAVWFFNKSTGEIYQKHELEISEPELNESTISNNKPIDIIPPQEAGKKEELIEPEITVPENLKEKAINFIQPATPPAAKAVRATGAVRVDLTISEEGRVISATAVSGHALLRQAAESAARQSTFTPKIVNGKKVMMTGFVIYNFN